MNSEVKITSGRKFGRFNRQNEQFGWTVYLTCAIGGIETSLTLNCNMKHKITHYLSPSSGMSITRPNGTRTFVRNAVSVNGLDSEPSEFLNHIQEVISEKWDSIPERTSNRGPAVNKSSLSDEVASDEAEALA